MPEVNLPVGKDDQNSDTTSAVDSLTRRAASLSDQLFHEIATDASLLVDRSFVGKDTVTGRSLNAFRRMRDKLDSLGFLDHRCMPVVDRIDVVLDALPKQGPYNGVAFNSLFTLGLLLSDPDKIKRHGSGLLQMESISVSDEDDVDAEMLNSSPVVPVADTSPANTDDDNDLPGFDDFLSNYSPAQDVFDATPSVDAGISLDNVAQDVLNPIPESNGFMASVKETVQVASETASTSIPVQSKDETESPATEEVVEDFWF